MPTLTLKLKNKSLGEYQLQKGVSLTIGRREANDVVIEDPSVSGHHYKIDALGDRFLLIDLQSKNGSFVNEQLINSHWLKHEDIITIGGHSLLFNYHENEQMHDDGSDEFDETQVMDTTVKKSTILNDLDIIEIGSARLQFSIETPQKRI
jgi:pSer/pThr/pTyr-binding forkhead associated (FHA) protein